jgi:hypothetical protein
MAFNVRIVFVLTSFLLLLLGLESEAAATPVPRQLYGKSVTIRTTRTEVWGDDTIGKNYTWNIIGTTIFYFSIEGRIFARISWHYPDGSRTYEQVGLDPAFKSGRPVLATGAGRLPGYKMGTFQDFRFEGRAFITTKMIGENSAARQTIEFDQNFASCTFTGVGGTDDGKPVRRTGWNGHVQRRISGQITDRRCTIQDGNAFQQ